VDKRSLRESYGVECEDPAEQHQGRQALRMYLPDGASAVLLTKQLHGIVDVLRCKDRHTQQYSDNTKPDELVFVGVEAGQFVSLTPEQQSHIQQAFEMVEVQTAAYRHKLALSREKKEKEM